MIFHESTDYGRYIVQPSGRPARIISTIGPVDAPIVAVVKCSDGPLGEMILCFNTDGETPSGHAFLAVTGYQHEVINVK